MTDMLIIGVAGGTGSGKSTVIRWLNNRFPGEVSTIAHDDYYRANHDLSYEERAKINYDAPESIETELMVEHLTELRKGNPIACPVYDYTVHDRSDETKMIYPNKVLVIDGILILADKRLRDLMDIKIFVDTDADIRVLRRAKRDMRDRGRSLESVIDQYLTTVKPMHELYVEPSKKYADIIIPNGGKNLIAMEMLASRISSHLNHGEPLSGPFTETL